MTLPNLISHRGPILEANYHTQIDHSFPALNIVETSDAFVDMTVSNLFSLNAKSPERVISIPISLKAPDPDTVDESCGDCKR